MSEPVNISESGGIAVVILGREMNMPAEYDLHPRVVPFVAADLPEPIGELAQAIPSTTKIVLIGGELPSRQYGNLRTVLARRNLTFLVRKNPAALADALAKVLPKKPAAVVDADAAPPRVNGAATAAAPDDAAPTKKLSVADFVRAEADLGKSNADEARRLLRLAGQRGIVSTFGSLAQAISQLKRKGGRTGVPRSVMSPQARALQTLDEAIAGLQLIREYVEDTEKQNAELTAKVAAFRRLLD